MQKQDSVLLLFTLKEEKYIKIKVVVFLQTL